MMEARTANAAAPAALVFPREERAGLVTSAQRTRVAAAPHIEMSLHNTHANTQARSARLRTCATTRSRAFGRRERCCGTGRERGATAPRLHHQVRERAGEGGRGREGEVGKYLRW
jgi:hypothetical protein